MARNMGSHDGVAIELREDAWDAVETVGEGLGCCVNRVDRVDVVDIDDRGCCVLDTVVVRPLAIVVLG